MLEVANREYESKLTSGSGDNKTMYKLDWKVKELSRLNERGRRIVTELKVLMDVILGNQRVNLNHKIYSIGQSLTSFIKGEMFEHNYAVL